LNKHFLFYRQVCVSAFIPALVLGMLSAAPMQKAHATGNVSDTPTAYSATEEEQDNIKVYQEAMPSVVSISNGRSQGAGVILTPDGLVVTNKHVIEGSSTVNLKTANETSYKAQVVSYGSGNEDLAFLKIMSNQSFPYMRLGDSSTVRVGQRVLAIGSPFGLDGTLTTGIVSRIDRERNLLQSDAAINPGNSGGPLLNLRGELIGINRSIINPVGASSAGISFAVPVNVIRQEVANQGLGASTVARDFER
jgi:serine protease Do